jgi:hypothetical protein
LLKKPIRPTKNKAKEKYEVMEIRWRQMYLIKKWNR